MESFFDAGAFDHRHAGGKTLPRLRIEAVDGARLSWDRLVQDGLVAPHAAHIAQEAEALQMPTLSSDATFFSPHLTKGAVGCALSHRQAWQAVMRGFDWAVILEDDVQEVSPCFAAELESLFHRLPTDWDLVYLGHHSYDFLVPKAQGGRVVQERPPGGVNFAEAAESPGGDITGLYGYLVSRAGAAKLEQIAFPLEEQVDVSLGRGYASCVPETLRPVKLAAFGIQADQMLLLSSLSELSLDSDVQVIGPAPSI